MTIHYRITPKWLRGLFAAGRRKAACTGVTAFNDRRTFERIVPLYLHGTMESQCPPVDAQISANDLGRLFQDARQKFFLADASKVARRAVGLREGAVWFVTSDALTSKFIPPPAADVPVVLPILLRLLKEFASTSRTRADVAFTAFAGYQALLTLHPFPDCNGRVARMFFASCLVKGMVESPAVLLSLPLMLRSGAFEYHAASWESRAGDHSLIMDLFTSKIDEAEKAFGSFLENASACEETSQTATLHCWEELCSPLSRISPAQSRGLSPELLPDHSA